MASRIWNDREGRVIALAALVVLLLPGAACHSRTEGTQAQPRARTPETASDSGRPARMRAPAVAGLFYPAESQALSQTVDALLEKAPTHFIPRLRGLICPHAGYVYSGQTAAEAYRTLAGRDVRTVVILGPSHYAAFPGVSVVNADAYQTPLGSVPVSEWAQQLVRTRPFALEQPCPLQRPPWWSQSSKPAPPPGGDTPETWEHSVEVQVPFLQRTLKDFKVLPLIFGDADAEAAARVLADTIDDKTVVVASSDLSHYYPDAIAKGLDARCVRAICDLDIDGMKIQEACGKLPILTLMHLARLKGWRAQLLERRNSGEVSADKDRVVGYAAIAFYAPPPANLARSEQKFLLDLARQTLSRVASNGALPEIPPRDLPPKLAETRACFVTLTENGSLRGCIGHLQPQAPLYQAVADNARNAALRDPRFLPVQPEEVDRIRIEISVLTEPHLLQFNSPDELLGHLQPYEDGVVLQMGPRAATFLPQVWEQIPDKVEFLNQLSRKAGCAPSAWRGKETSVSIYHVEAFEESE